MARVLLLVPSATYRIADFLQAARALGVEVVIASDEPHALADLMGSRTLTVCLDDPEETAEAVCAHDAVAPLDAVVGVDDRGVLAAAVAAERLGLRHNAPDAVAATRDKLVMRDRLAAAEVPQPRYAALSGTDGPDALRRALETVGLPCVVKPTTLSASQGVLRADSAEEATAVVKRVSAIAAKATGDASPTLLVESFLGGVEVAVEGLLHDGTLTVLAIFDKPDPLDGPAFEETIYVTPTRLPPAERTAVEAATGAACRALGLTEGPVHAEIRVDEGRARVIEVAARTIGGLCARTLTFSTGRSLEQLVLTQALGLRLGPTRRRSEAAGVLMIPIPGRGVLEQVAGTEAARRVAGVCDLQLTIAPGTVVEPVPEGNRYLGFVFARADTAARVETALRAAQAHIEVRIVPEAEVPAPV